MKHCKQCKSILDDYEIEICSACEREQEFNPANHLDKLTELLNEFEFQVKCDYGLRNISGGFVEAEYNGCDDDLEEIYVELKCGVQSDCEHNVSIEDWNIPYDTFKRFVDGEISIRDAIMEMDNCN